VSSEETRMSKTVPTIRSVRARAVVAPIARPVKNAFGVIEAAPLVLIDVVTDQGVTGRSYIFAYSRLTLKPLVHLVEEIGRDLGKAIAPYDLMAAMDAKFRLLGWQGLVGMAVSGLDMAFWDALGQTAGQPLVTLLGGSPRPIRVYDSYGVVDPVADEKDLRRSLDQGFAGIKIKGGDGDAANDERVVKGVRALLGPDIALMLDSTSRSIPPKPAVASPGSRLTICTGSRSRWRPKPSGPRAGAGNLGDLDSIRRELVVSARLCRSDRGRRQRLHHARFDEGRRHHRLAPRRRPGRGRLDPDVEPPVRGGQFAHAGGDADRALARGSGPCPGDSRPPDRDRRRSGDGPRARPWVGMERNGRDKVSGVNGSLQKSRKQPHAK
jgi:hypothetical protein